MSDAIGTYTDKRGAPTRRPAPHQWQAGCHGLGEGEGPCFDARWIERSLAVEVEEPRIEPVSRLAAGLSEIATLLD